MADANTLSAELIAKACNECGVERLIHFSTVGASPSSSSEIDVTKYKGEEAVFKHFPSATIIRLCPVFGFNDKLLNKIGQLAIRFGWFMPVVFPSESRLQPIFVRDVATGFIEALQESRNARGKIYEFGGPEIFDWTSFTTKAAKEYGLYEGPVKSVPPFLGNFIVKGMSKSRSGIFAESDIEYFSNDRVVSKDALTIQHLGVTPTDIAEPALSILRVYRKPSKKFDVVN